MKQFFQDVKNSFLLSAAVSIILGIVLIVYPVKTSLLICYIAGALLLFGGVVALIRYIASRGEPFFFRYDLFVALVLILFGCFVIFESDLVIAFIPVVIGIILLANGLLSIQKAFNLKKTGLEKWWLEFLLALLTSVLGIIICTIRLMPLQPQTFSSVSALSTAAFPILSPPTTWAAQNAGSKTSSRPRSTSRKSCTMTM